MLNHNRFGEFDDKKTPYPKIMEALNVFTPDENNEEFEKCILKNISTDEFTR